MCFPMHDHENNRKGGGVEWKKGGGKKTSLANLNTVLLV